MAIEESKYIEVEMVDYEDPDQVAQFASIIVVGGETDISSDPDNLLTKGSDEKLYVPNNPEPAVDFLALYLLNRG